MSDSSGAARSRTSRRTNSLLINVSTLLQEAIGSVRFYTLECAPCRLLGDAVEVDGELRLLRTDQSVLATSQLATAVLEICGGCLAEFESPLELSFDEEFWPPADPISGERLEPPPEREGFAVVAGQLDLSEAVRQYVELARPMSPRCGPACPGMGAEAAPDGAEPDARWAALAALREELGE